MLRKWFNNPWVVGGLGVLALVYVAFAVLPGIGEPADAALIDDLPPDLLPGDPAFGAEVVLGPEGQATIVRPPLEWFSDLPRDPFIPVETELPYYHRPAVEAPATRTPELHAVFHASSANPGAQGATEDQTQSRAVIDAQLVGIGDAVAGYHVDEIRHDAVLVRKDGLSFLLKPRKESR